MYHPYITYNNIHASSTKPIIWPHTRNLLPHFLSSLMLSLLTLLSSCLYTSVFTGNKKKTKKWLIS